MNVFGNGPLVLSRARAREHSPRAGPAKVGFLPKRGVPRAPGITMRVTLIYNPGAGDDDQPGAGDLERLVRAAGHEIACVSSKDAGWEAALDRPADVIAVAGGDGTVGRVARRLAGRNVPLTMLPMGTANNIAT